MGCRKTRRKTGSSLGPGLLKSCCGHCVLLSTTLQSNTEKWSEVFLEEAGKNGNGHEMLRVKCLGIMAGKRIYAQKKDSSTDLTE